ncbi:Uncharacterised protein [Mycobacterium tuberculosis]|nr:Uncharacterised protein [Mycobacterium tuberculosis]
MPTFARPDPRAPTLRSPDAPEVAEARFKKPELAPPKLPKPEAPPAPVLKKPDDGLVVEFPKPGAAGILMSGILMAPPPVMVIAVFGPPMATVVVGPTTVMFGMVMGPKWARWPAIDERTISPVGGIVTPIRVMLPAEAVIGISMGIFTPRLMGRGISITRLRPTRPW